MQIFNSHLVLLKTKDTSHIKLSKTSTLRYQDIPG